MTTIDKSKIHFIQNGEGHFPKVYNRPTDNLADEIQRGFNSIDSDLDLIRTKIADAIRDTATLKLDFATNEYGVGGVGSFRDDSLGFGDIVTFGRSTGGGRFNEQGLYEYVGVNVPRFDHDPSTVRTNLVIQSGSFGGSEWVRERITVSDGTVVGLDGELSASKLIEDTTTNSHRLRQNIVVMAGTTYTLYAFVKASERTKVRLFAGGTSASADFDLVSLQISNQVNTIGATITNLPDGWVRVSISYRQTFTGSALHLVALLNENGSFSYLGDGVSGVSIFGVQLSPGVDVYDYIPTEATAISTPAEPLGLLVEETRTNLFPSSNGDGTFGNVPTFTANAVISPDGTSNATLINSGASPNRYELALTSGSSGLATGQVFTISWWELPINYSIGTCLSPQSFVNADIISGTFALVQTLPSGWKRYSVQASIIDGSQLARFRLYLSGGMSGVVDPCAIWGIQVEIGSLLTSLIPTSGAAVTRAVDRAYVSQTGWLNALESTLYAESSSMSQNNGYRATATVSDGTSRHRAGLYRKHSTDTIGFTAYLFERPRGAQLNNSSNFNSVGFAKQAMGWDRSTFAMVGNGGDVVSNLNSPELTSLNRLLIGAGSSVTAEKLAGHIKSIRYIPKKLTDDELKKITSH